MTYKKQVAQQIILSVLSPVLSVLFAFKSSHKKFIVFSGTLFMGLVGSVFIYLPGNDGHSHLQNVERHYMDMSIADFFSKALNLILLKPVEGSSDVYLHLLSYLAGGLFGIPELIHFFGGLILGYFFTKSVLLVLESNESHKKGLLLISFVALFLIVRSISALNSLRMWTAMWIFFYGAYALVKRENRKYLWVMLFSFFVHFSYLIYIVPIIVALVFKKQRILIAGLYIASFFFSLTYQTATDLAPDLALYETKSKTYLLTEERIEQKEMGDTQRTTDNFYKEFGPTIYFKFSIVLLAFILLFLYSKNKVDKNLQFLIASGVLLLSLSNIVAGFSPSIAGRGQTIGATFLTAAAINTLIIYNHIPLSQFSKRLIRIFFTIFLLSTIPYILFNISYALNTTSIFILFMPFISWMIGKDDISIRDFIAELFL